MLRAGILDASVGPLSPFGTFRSIHNRPYEGDRYLGLFWEHNFKAIPFEFLGLWGLARRGVDWFCLATDPPKRGWRRRLQRLAIPPQSPYP